MGADVSQALVGSSSYRKINLLTYFREGHVQMKVRFPKASRWPILWPLLWPATFFCFLKNTYTIRNTTLRQTLKDFRKATRKQPLFRFLKTATLNRDAVFILPEGRCPTSAHPPYD